MRVIIKSREKIIVNHASNRGKRLILTLFLNAFNIKLNIKKRYDIHINPPILNIRLIKIPRVPFYTNNKINIFNHFIKIIPTWEVAKLSQGCTSRAIFLNGFVGLEFAKLHVDCLDRFAVSYLGKPRLGPFEQNFSTPLRHC